jgi:hypothetical protein
MHYHYLVRKFLAFVLLLILSSFSAVVPADAAAKIGDACKSVGQTATLNGSSIICVKSGSKLVWSKVQSYDAAFAKAHLLQAQAKAAEILADAKSSAEQISRAPYCVTTNSKALVSIGVDESTGLGALIFSNPGICDISVQASASFKCSSPVPLPPSKNTTVSTGVFPLKAREKLVASYNFQRFFPQVLSDCRLLTGFASNTVNISRDGQLPNVITLTSSYSGTFNQIEASKRAENLLKAARMQAEKVVTNAKNPVMIAKAWKAAADKAAADKAAADKAAADKAATEKSEVDALSITCVPGGPCKVGNTGPGGGTVFYDAGNQQSWGRYLEFAPNGWSGSATDPVAQWCDLYSLWSVETPQAREVGQGKPNSKLMVQYCADGAAKLAASYQGGAKRDWFLPSRDELNELCKYASRQITGNTGIYCQISENLREGFESSKGYWSSTGKNDYQISGYIYGSWFGWHHTYTWLKLDKLFVRPVRSF